MKQHTLVMEYQIKQHSFTGLAIFKFKCFNHKPKQICIERQFEDISISSWVLSVRSPSIIRSTAFILNFEPSLTARENFFLY